MDDVFFKKLKQVNISEDTEKTKTRLKEIWENADKKNKKELLKNAGPTIYNAIGKITKSGRITAKMTILMSRYLDVNPLYLIADTDDREHYSEILLKEFLTKLGYKNLWKEYEKYITKFNMEDATAGQAEQEPEPEESEEPEESTIEQPKPEPERQDAAVKENREDDTKDEETPFSEIMAKFVAVDTSESIPLDNLRAVNSLSDDETIILLRALMIRAKIKTDISKVADQIKSLLLLN